MTHYKAFIDDNNKLHYISLTYNGRQVIGERGITANTPTLNCNKCGSSYYICCDTCYYHTIIEHTKEEIDQLIIKKKESDKKLADAMIDVNYLNAKN
jgi:hypothetical protein